jgi:short-subunit dehydrogenase
MSNVNTDQHIVVLGGSRGLGKACINEFIGLGYKKVLNISRAPLQLEGIENVTLDLASPESAKQVLKCLEDRDIGLVLYSAGGGPYKKFFKHSWSAHEWALRLNQLTPAEILHGLGAGGYSGLFAYVGSAIADSPGGDPNGPSYGAGKAGMGNLIRSLSKSGNQNCLLFSPGYMDTEMVPVNAAVRQSPESLLPVDRTASVLCHWLLNGDRQSPELKILTKTELSSFENI